MSSQLSQNFLLKELIFPNPVDTGRKLNVHKTFSLRPVSTGKVRVIIDELPFTNEGYTRAKNILISKYGKSSEVANAHIQNIVLLLHIYGVNIYKIHEFTEKLLGSVHALEAIGKLKKINGYMSG